ncbi:uncharacterized protein LOC114261894 [Camellia sinensis]|uniref:uncharacterized protein LOC114261894 n=1 Tax=Camellia sinensis TaxID=4442 RepID=UPI0010364AF2|nr:uncharacterized protein LOC114261894 [Camellia sinensis]
MIDFIKKYIVHRFGLPRTITVDQETVFNGDEVMEFSRAHEIQMLNSSPYYAQANRDSIQASPFELVYGHAAVLPLEVTVRSSRVDKHYDIPIDEYVEAMFMELQDVECKRMVAFDCLMAQKKKINKVYNKKARLKIFGVGDLVWKTILPLGTKDTEFGKWSPKWSFLCLIMTSSATGLNSSSASVVTCSEIAEEV